MKTIGKALTVIGVIATGMTAVAVIKKPSSVYKDKPEEQNPMQGKMVQFVENEAEPENADGVRGHLEAIGPSDHSPSFYEGIVKRVLDIALSFGALVVLSPVFLILSLWILKDDPGPVLFTQKRIGKDKQYFKLHNISKKIARRLS
ncbi:MAG: sugar transferase [Synergistes sp.]|nr:sugar transferase [Synergistes sp.]